MLKTSIVVNAAHSQQDGDSWIQASGLHKQTERISAHWLYYVIVTLVCKTHSSVILREFRTLSEIAKNSQNTV